MHELVPDACFLIDLRDCKRLGLLVEVAGRLSWRLVTCESAYYEATFKPLGADVRELVKQNILNVSGVDESLVTSYRVQHPQLGKGELGCLAYAVTRKENGVECVIVSDDQRAKKAFDKHAIQHFGTFDFVEKSAELGIISVEESKLLATELSKNKWMMDGVLERFHKRMDGKKKRP